jgi:N6-L-threonylcarbamoyladenine synthase
MAGRPDCDFSFSGLKTAVRHAIAALPGGEANPREAADLAAAFQEAVADVLADRTGHAIARFREEYPGGPHLVVAGGVAANARIREVLGRLAAEQDMQFVAPPPALCTDNAAMVAWAGVERLRLGLVDDLEFPARPRWPLGELSAQRGSPK